MIEGDYQDFHSFANYKHLPAFPCDVKLPTDDGIATLLNNGLNRQELFAAMAMQALISSAGTHGNFKPDPWGTASEAIRYANALLEKLEPTPVTPPSPNEE